MTTIYVTHDQVEAMTMGNRVAVMRTGELQQVAPTQELYDRPVNLFVAGFIGSPAMNMLDAVIESSNGGLAAKVGDQTISLGPEALENHPALKGYVGKQVVLGIRPEDLEDAALETGAPPDRRIRGKVELTEALGSEILAHFAIEARSATTPETRELAKDIGGDRPVTVVEQDSTVIVSRFNPRSRAKDGDTVEIAVDTRALHFFDPETGNGIYDSTEGAKA